MADPGGPLRSFRAENGPNRGSPRIVQTSNRTDLGVTPDRWELEAAGRGGHVGGSGLEARADGG